MKGLLGVGLIWKCTQSPPGDREERSGLEEMEGRLVPRGVSDNQSPACLDHSTTVRTAEEAGDPRGGRISQAAGGGWQGRHKCPEMQGSQPTRERSTAITMEWVGEGSGHSHTRAHSSNFPSRMCSKEKGRNLKPVPL